MRIFEQLGPLQDLSDGFKRAPVGQWKPSYCGKMDLKIDRQGIWWHEGKPIRRAGLVRVLASVLTYENQQWYLKSPTEQLRIEVEDAPFIVTQCELTEAKIQLTTNVGEQFFLQLPWALTLDPEGEWRPWIQLHEAIGARLSRPLLLRLVDSALMQNADPEGDTLYWAFAGLALPLGKL